MSETNFDSKLQKTITMMQEINQLMGDAEIQSQNHKDESFMKDSIMILKQNILNQNESHFIESQERLDNPPTVIIEINGQKIEQIDQEAFQELKQNLVVAQKNFEMSQTDFSDARYEALFIKNQLTEKDQVKNILESELDQLHNQVSSLLDTIKQDGKSGINAKPKDKELVKESGNDYLHQKNKELLNSREGQKPYFKDNLHVNDFHKAIDSCPTRTTYMPIQAIDDN